MFIPFFGKTANRLMGKTSGYFFFGSGFMFGFRAARLCKFWNICSMDIELLSFFYFIVRDQGRIGPRLGIVCKISYRALVFKLWLLPLTFGWRQQLGSTTVLGV